MDPLSYFALGLAPGIFWLWIFVRGNRQRPDPSALVIRTFILGVLSALPIVVVEHLVGGELRTEQFGEIVFVSFVVAGLVEELGKYLVVRLSLGSSPYLDEPLRGLVYSAAVALGFASIENVAFMFSFGPEVLAPRAVLCTLAHVSFSALWGYGLGADRLARANGKRPRGLATLGLLLAIAAHGVYDVAAFSERTDLLFPIFVGSVATCVGLFVRANARSIHRGRSRVRQIRCTACKALGPVGKRFCSECGTSLPRHATVHCGACHEVIESRAAYCVRCGAHQATDA